MKFIEHTIYVLYGSLRYVDSLEYGYKRDV